MMTQTSARSTASAGDGSTMPDRQDSGRQDSGRQDSGRQDSGRQAGDAGPAALKAYDVEAVRADFPVLEQRILDWPLVYLDNAATTQKPRAVLDAMRRHLEHDCSNVHRGVHTLSQRATQAYEHAREVVRSHLGAARSEEIVFVRGTTEAINLVAHSFVRPRLEPGDEILVSEMEHHSNIVPWQLAAEACGATLKVIPFNERGELELDRYRELLGERTRFVSLVHVSNALGTINPVAEMVRLAHDRDIPVLIDGAQAVPHMPVDVAALGCDFYAFSGHKVYGPSGIGALYGRYKHLEKMPPFQGGGDMIVSVSFERTTYADPPYRFEAGTPSIEGAIGLAAALQYVQGVGLEAIMRHEHRLLEQATAAIGAIPGVRLIGTAPAKASVLGFVMDGIHPHDVGTILDQHGVAVRAGHHCAQPVMQHFGVPATVRASFGLYNTDQEVEALVTAVHAVREVFG